MYTIAWWLPFTKEKRTYQFQIVSKFAEIKIFRIILSPSLNSTTADLILTVLNQRLQWLIINWVQIWCNECNMNMYFKFGSVISFFLYCYILYYYAQLLTYLITVLTGIKGFSYQVHNFFIVRLVFPLHILCNLNAS